MSVNIASNIKKEKAFIDINGNIVNKDTKEIIEPLEEKYIPPAKTEQTEQTEKKEGGNKLNELIEKKIASKIDDIISKKIDDILNNL